MGYLAKKLIPAFAALFVLSGHACAEKRALVIGIDNYHNVAKLKNAASDATKIAEQLTAFGYKTVLLTDDKATRIGIVIAWQNFLNALKDGDDAIVFYSGHGVEVEGANFIVPSDSPSGDDLGGANALKLELLSLPSMISDLNKKPLDAMIWILDACRNNPFVTSGRAIGTAAGLVSMEGPPGIFLFFSANYGQTALDGRTDDPPAEKNSIYTRTLLKAMRAKPRTPVYELAREIRPVVKDLASPHDQRPAYYDGLDKPWCFTECEQIPVRAIFATATGSVDQPTEADIVRTTASNVRALTTESPNAIFLGKKSSIENCTVKSRETYPFGCDVLKTLVENRDKNQLLIGKPLAVTTAVNVRKRAPTVQEKAGAIYGCVVDTLNEGDTVTLTGILDLSYLNDIFYWGTLDQTPKDCRHS